MSDIIKPCPFCEAVGSAEAVGFANYKVVRCAVCIASGPSCDTAEQAIAAWNAAPRVTAPASNTVRVRVAVSVSARGDWLAHGGNNWTEDDTLDAIDHCDGDRLAWIAANVPLPEPAAEIEAEIEP